jgi:hypothetical protein
MLDDFRTRPRETLTKILNGPQERDPKWRPPASVRALEWMFLRNSRATRIFGAIALRAFGVSKSPAK